MAGDLLCSQQTATAPNFQQGLLEQDLYHMGQGK